MIDKLKQLVLEINEDEYRGLNLPSYSLLKDLDEIGPEGLIAERVEKKASYLDYGALVDTLLLLPDEFDTKFKVTETTAPTASTLELANKCIEREVTDSYNALEIVEELGLWKSTKDKEKLVDKFNNDNFWIYIREQIEAKGKILIDLNTFNKAREAVFTLKNHKFTKHLFNGAGLNQPKLSSKLWDVDVKGMLDRVIVVKNKLVAIDLKTGNPSIYQFTSNFYTYKYYLQQALYRKLLEEITGENVKFVFVYISSNDNTKPIIYPMTDSWYYRGLEGWKSNSGKEYTGVKKLIEDYKWYKEHNIYDYKREVYDEEGMIYIPEN